MQALKISHLCADLHARWGKIWTTGLWFLPPCHWGQTKGEWGQVTKFQINCNVDVFMFPISLGKKMQCFGCLRSSPLYEQTKIFLKKKKMKHTCVSLYRSTTSQTGPKDKSASGLILYSLREESGGQQNTNEQDFVLKGERHVLPVSSPAFLTPSVFSKK